MTSLEDLHRKWSRSPAYREAYDALGPEFERLRAQIKADIAAEIVAESAPEEAEAGRRPVGRMRTSVA